MSQQVNNNENKQATNPVAPTNTTDNTSKGSIFNIFGNSSSGNSSSENLEDETAKKEKCKADCLKKCDEPRKKFYFFGGKKHRSKKNKNSKRKTKKTRKSKSKKSKK